MNNQTVNKNITILERIVMFLLVSNLPIIFLLNAYLNKGFSWDLVNPYRKVSIVFIFLIIVFFIFQLILKRDYLALFFGCHQNHNRSFVGVYKLLRICARCTGILLGIFIAPLLSFLNISILYFLLGIIPLLIDGIAQKYTKYKSNNLRRIITGILFGPAMIVICTYFFFYSCKLIIWLASVLVNV